MDVIGPEAATRMQQPAGIEVAAYERVSKDESGIERSPEQQHEGHLDTCAQFGWAMSEKAVYREVGSASKYQRKARAAFDRLIADLRGGRFTAKVLMLYAINRGSRKTGEWLDLIDLCEELGIVFWVTIYDRIVDPKKPRDRKLLIDDASKGELDVAEMSQTIRRATAAAAKKGLPHARIPYGYRRIYDERTRKFVRQEPDPVEAPILQEMYRRVLKGESLRGIAKDLNTRGSKRRGGGDWNSQNIGFLLLHETYLGIRVHDPNRRSVYDPMTPDAVVTQGVWEPLVDKPTWLAVKRILRDPSRLTNLRPGAVIHLLSGIVACAKCSEPLRVNLKKRKYWRYVCVKNGCVNIDKFDLEEYAERLMLKYLETLDEYLLVDDTNTELAEVLAQLAEARSDYDDVTAAARARKDAGKAKSKFATERAMELEDEIADLEKREAELRTPSALSGLITPGAGVRREWADAAFSTKREIAKIILAPTPHGTLGLGQLRVEQIGPTGRGRKVMPIERTHFYRPEKSEVKRLR
ncbi:recombinase family protein [Amycolatopsis sp. NPDC058340]|uniref:recombinase family protein n=1 Tax=Amycolatopsis sp. NPDC058340 TaxID=3346453 RepID=UPI00365188E3